MGLVRSLPENQVSTVSEAQEGFYFVTASVCGWQYLMEDFHTWKVKDHISMFAIFDGHHGPEVAELCKYKFVELFEKNELIKLGQIQAGLQTLLYELQQTIFGLHESINQIRVKHKLPALQEGDYTRAGCSAVIVVFSQEEIIICNIGLCRCYAIYKKDKAKAILFSGNHIVSNKQEELRISRNQGFVFDGKINGIYPYTRSIGDFHIKRENSKYIKAEKSKPQDGLITSEASFFCLRRQDINGIIMGSSGFWEKSQRVSQVLVQLGRGEQNDKQKIQDLLCRMMATEPAKQKLGLQNMTSTYIHFTN